MSLDVEFDIRNPNAQLAGPKHRKGLAGLFLVAVMIIVWAGLLYVFERTSASGLDARSELALVVLVGFTGFTIAVGVVVLRGWRNVRSSGASLTCDEKGLEIVFSDGRTAKVDWSDPELSFMLLDFSRTDPALLLSSAPYAVVLRRTTTALTLEAFNAILSQVQRQELVGKVERGSPWEFGASSAPTIYYIQGKPRHEPS